MMNRSKRYRKVVDNITVGDKRYFHVKQTKFIWLEESKVKGSLIKSYTTAESSEEYEVEKILAWDTVFDRYLIEWAGYDLASSTWEPVSNIRNDAPQCIKIFHRQLQHGYKTAQSEVGCTIWVPQEFDRWGQGDLDQEPIKNSDNGIKVQSGEPTGDEEGESTIPLST
ncbi:hypothetical protein TWF970_010768 [Orbilia oligospora]|uniref:Chromo domain-containing protein n=1 Tax=Orbilia oligospora TaxID=2813651 RepID=A0A7C8V8V7_ORBOL|nr:hypothetical protein TWF970_010768 [Orbilia oligospora]